MHKINLEVSKRAEFERDERRERERTQKKREKRRKKRNNFFFNRLRGHRAGKIFFGEHVIPTKKPRCRKKKLRK
jgi:hypothetical protein